MGIKIILAIAVCFALTTPHSLDSMTYEVRTATTTSEHRKGLQGVTNLAEHQGMLFIFKEEVSNPFWMKDTQIPLSIVFINSNQIIVDVKQGQPMSIEYIYPSKPYKYVLEVLTSSLEKEPLTTGDSLDLSALTNKNHENKKES